MAPARPGVFYGGTDVPLSPAGREEAAAAARLLAGEPLDRIVASPLSRARFGAERILEGRNGLAIQIEEELREVDRGRWVGLTPEEIEREFPGQLAAHEGDLANWREHEGESMGDLRARVLAVRDRLMDELHGRSVGLVAHLWPVRAILADADGASLEEWKRFKVPTGSVSCAEFVRRGDRVEGRVHFVGRKL